MKKNDWILISAAASYSYLFYQQAPGINFMIFTLILILLFAARNYRVLNNINWKITALGAIVSGVFVMLYGNSLSVAANLLSLMVLSAYTFTASSSFLIALAQSAYSVITACSNLFKSYKHKQRKKNIHESFPIYIKHLTWLIPLVITIIFFLIYREANPVFSNLTKDIRINFISIPWILFTILGTVLVYGLLFPRKIKSLFIIDKKAKNTFNSSDLTDYNSTWFGKYFGMKNEVKTGAFLLILLNILLLSVNIIDIGYLWIDQKIPEGMSYSQYVHQGTELIIFSVISAIFIILFFFRGHLNFYEGNKYLKYLAYAWIIQNIFMIVSTGYRNQLYIEVFGLTYKRLGVYMYLLLTLAGLITTFIKVKNIKSSWFLFRKNAWILYSLLILACIVNWDKQITNYNLSYSKNVDIEYLIDLSYINIPYFIEANPQLFTDDDIYYGSKRMVSIKKQLKHKIILFENEYKQSDWQSWSFHKSKVFEVIQNHRQNIQKGNVTN
ncbi:MAG: DUF4173 domain-containing protein [Bacteroidota bacterium]|nr:DUF4173 domain-containing protein [Bacteroidota bacterium]